LKDRFFYPLAILTILLIIGIALRPGLASNGPSAQEVLESGYSTGGEDLRNLITPTGMFVEIVESPDGTVNYAILKMNIPVELTQPSQGVFIALDPVYEKTFSGQNLKITIIARAGRTDPLDKFRTAYFSGEKSSGWKQFTLTPDFENYEFAFKTPDKEKVLWREYIGIWPGDAGDSKTIEVKDIKIEVVPEQKNKPD
jgi:hypothetical protein